MTGHNNIVDEELRHVLAKRGDTRSYDDLLVLKSRIAQIDYIRGIFFNLHPQQIDELCRCMTLEIYHEDEFVFYQGQKGDKLYLVLSGSCDVLLKQRTGVIIENEDGTTTEEFNYQVIFTCNSGQHFGERALDYDEPRAASIRASTFSELLTITQQAYRKILKVPDYSDSDGVRQIEGPKGMVNRVLSYTREKRKDTDLHAVAEYLSSHIPFFQKFDLENRIELIRMCELVKIWGKTTIFEQGDQGQAFYVILTGSVDVIVNETDDDGLHHSHLVRTLEAGQSFGERALEADSGGKRAATIVTSNELTELIIINREEYQSIVSVMFEGDMTARVRLLRSTELFAPLDLKNLHIVAKVLQPKTFRLKKVLFKAGEIAKDLFIIHKGECNLDSTLRLENGSMKEVHLGRAGPSAILGDYTFDAMSYYDDTHYRETAVATSLCATFVLSKLDFFNVIPQKIRTEVIERIRNFTPASASMWNVTPQLISEGDWCIRQTWKKFRQDIIQRDDKKNSDKTITRHFQDHVRNNNSIGLAETKNQTDSTPPSVKINRFSMDSFPSKPVLLPQLNIYSPRSLSGLQPAGVGKRQSPIKFSVCRQTLNIRSADGSLVDAMDVDDDEVSLLSDGDGTDVVYRSRKKKVETLQLTNTQKVPERHGPAGASHIHVQSQLGSNSTITFKPFALVQLHRNVHNDLGARRTIETSMRLCGAFEYGDDAKNAAESQILNCYIKMNKLTFNVTWHRFSGFENMPLDQPEHFIVYCRSVPVEYASFHTIQDCDLTKMPFPPSCKIAGQNYACVTVNELKKSVLDKDVDRTQLGTKGLIADVLHPLYSREISVVGEVFAVTHTKLECTRFSCLALKDIINIPPHAKLIVATLYVWYMVCDEVLSSLVPREFESVPISIGSKELEDDSVEVGEIHREFSEILDAYGGDDVSATSRREVDKYSTNSISQMDNKLIRRDLQSRGICNNVERRLATAPHASRKRPTFLSKKSSGEDKAQNGLILTDNSFDTRRDNIKTLIESRNEIIRMNDEYCNEEFKLINGEYLKDSGKSIQRQVSKKDRLMGEKELLQSISSKRLDVLNALNNAPTLKAVKSDSELPRIRKQRSTRLTRHHNNQLNNNQASHNQTNGNNIPASVTLQEKLDALEELMSNKSSTFSTAKTPKRVNMGTL